MALVSDRQSDPHDRVEAFLRGALQGAGVEVDDADIGLLLAVHAALSEGFAVLASADLGAVPLEWDLDPSRAPTQ